MPSNRYIRGLIFSCVIIIFGIIHFAVGIGIVRRYNKYDDIFQQQVGLAGFNIFIGFFTMVIGVIGLVSIIIDHYILCKITAIGAFIFGIIALASLIAALVLSGKGATHFRDSLTDNMNDYIQDQDAIDTIDTLQSDYECCGVNLWLDWSRVQLGATNGINNGRRRRRHGDEDSSPTQVISRQKRQIITPGTIYNLPSSYTINLPSSCCIDNSGTSTGGNSLGSYCMFNSDSSLNSFYVRGCLEPVCNVGFAQITGIAVINTCLTMLMFVYFGKMIKLISNNDNLNNEQGSQIGIYPEQQQQPQQQYSYEQYYRGNINPKPYFIYDGWTYQSYH